MSKEKNINRLITCRDVHGRASQAPLSGFRFRPSVYGLLLEDDKILLSRQWDGYDFPGGGIELDERIEEALRREFWEETGLKVEPVQPFHCETDFFNPDYADKYKGQYWNAVMMYYLVRRTGGELNINNLSDNELEYADKPEWVDLTEIVEKKFFNSVDSVKLIRSAVKLQRLLGY